MKLAKFLPALVLTIVLASPASAEGESVQYKKLLTPLLQSGQTIIGQDIAYPAGKPQVTAAMVIIGPGKETGWHIHRVPLFVYVLQGEISVDYGSKGVKVYEPGDSFL